jgi:hypothetical protein
MHDSKLFVQETRPGRYDVYRKSQTNSLLPHFIFSITEDWTVKSRPVQWSSDIVLNRIKAHDIWRDDTFVEKLIQSYEKNEESKERAFRTSVEGFLYDFRSQFHKATNGINTANLNKLNQKEL